MSEIVPDMNYDVYRPLFLNTFTRVGQKHDPVFVFHFFPDFRKRFPNNYKSL